MTTERHVKLGRQTAFISFLLGTAIFSLYFLTSSFELLLVGYGFIALTGFVNLIILISILLKANKDKDNRTKFLKTSGLMLLNIPVMFFYCWAASMLLGIMRITFRNDTGTEITNIRIFGCDDGHIDKLEKGESKTVWVKIAGDCSIYVDYLSNGQRKKQTVAGYVTSSMGQKVTHTIDGKNKDLF